MEELSSESEAEEDEDAMETEGGERGVAGVEAIKEEESEVCYTIRIYIY